MVARLFLNLHGYPHFSFWIPITLDKIYSFPIVKTFEKNTSVLGGTVNKKINEFQQ